MSKHQETKKFQPIDLLRLLPILILVVLLINLGNLNASSEVYVDVETSRIEFRTLEKASLFQGWVVDSVSYRNSDLYFYASNAKEVFEEESETEEIRVQALNKSQPNSFSIVPSQGSNNLLFKGIRTPPNTKVILEAGPGYVDIIVQSDKVPVQSAVVMSDNFYLIGRNNTAETVRLDDSRRYEIGLDPIFESIQMVHATRSQIRLFLSKNLYQKQKMNEESIRAVSVAFNEPNVFTDNPILESRIQSATIQISGTDFFKKLFMLKEEIVDAGHFLELSEFDEYDIQIEKLSSNTINSNLFCESARELKVGKRFRFLHSIIPTKLEYLIEEPGKRSLIGLIVGIITQVILVRKYIGKTNN